MHRHALRHMHHVKEAVHTDGWAGFDRFTAAAAASKTECMSQVAGVASTRLRAHKQPLNAR
jgi:hypothetical protein